jgi:hypothetical protein
MKSLLYLIPLASLAMAIPGGAHRPRTPTKEDRDATSPPKPKNTAFTIIAAHSGSPIHLQPIDANGGQFWIGKPTATFCPSEVDCSKLTNDTTALICNPTDGSPGACSMSDEVPGGQQVYVRNDTGALGFTSPHSAFIPPGAFTSGFTYRHGTAGRLGSFSFEGGKATGLVACPANKNCDHSKCSSCAPWLIVAALPNVNVKNCLGFDGVTTGTNAQAWEYT